MDEYGHHLVGLYEVMMHDYEVCTVWATDARAHVRMAKARDVARGRSARPPPASTAMPASSAGTAGAHVGHPLARGAHDPAPDTLCAPAAVPVDDSAVAK